MRTTLLAIAVATSAACSMEAGLPEDAEDGFVVEDGKADDFLSLKAREFVVKGTARVVVEDGAGEIRARHLMAFKHDAISWFLNQYLVDKEKEGEDADANADYGGFSAMVKDGDYQDLSLVQKNATTWEFEFQQTIAGKKNLLHALPLGAGGTFTVEIGKPTNAEMEKDEWYRQDPWNAWDPAKVTADQKEPLALSIREATKSTDGWWDYARLFEDGKLTIDVHFGWDYNTAAAHLADSRAFYTWLLSKGFKSPVSSWDAYKRTSGPLTRTLDADGRDIKIEVRIFYPRPGTSTDPDTDAGGKQLETDMFESLKTRDVIVYSGHSGPRYGFALANWNKTDEGDVDDTELAVAELARGKYQIVFAEGCNTYMLGHTLLGNPSKQGKDIDVITTTSFSVSYSPVEDFLGRLIELDSQGRHRPRTMSATLEDLDLYSVGEPSPTMYGVHGIDDDPKVHPYANLENLCRSCSSNAACGGVGNACITVGHSGKRCVAACTDDGGCGEGYECKKVASQSTSTIYGSYCVPTSRSCE